MAVVDNVHLVVLVVVVGCPERDARGAEDAGNVDEATSPSNAEATTGEATDRWRGLTEDVGD